MRDILMVLIVFGSIPFILRKPYIGILMWAWLSYMNPHRLAYGFAYDMPFAQIIALVLFASILFSKEKKSIDINGTVIIWLFFVFWMGLTTLFSIYPDFAKASYINVLKIQLLTFLTLLLITNKERLDKLILVIAMSIGFYSIKGGIFTIMSGGAHRVWGPEKTFIEENNGLALATLMIIPLMVYLLYKANKKWLKVFFGLSIFLSLASVIGSQSRGALLAISAVMFFFWLKTKNKLATGILIIFLAAVGFSFMPDSWHDRMNTIENYEEDASAMGRINAWKYSINIANDRLFGGGFDSWSGTTYAVYSPDAEIVVVAHSIYFSVLADHGWIGLLLFLLVLLLSWFTLNQIISITTGKEIYNDQNMLAKMLQVSLIAYMSGGAFLSLSYFDLPWHIIAITLILKSQVKSKHNQPVSLLGKRV